MLTRRPSIGQGARAQRGTTEATRRSTPWIDSAGSRESALFEIHSWNVSGQPSITSVIMTGKMPVPPKAAEKNRGLGEVWFRPRSGNEVCLDHRLGRPGAHCRPLDPR